MNNIKSRVDNISLQGENFTYDNLNRLLDVYQGPLNQQFIGLVQSMNYDNLGNMTHKTDVGDMQYSTTHPFQMELLTENPQTITSEHVLDYFVSGRTKTIVDNDKKLQFTYGSDLQRRKMEYFLEDQLQSTTLYPFGNYEEVHNAATNDVLKYNYIGSPDGLIAIRKTTNGTSQLYYTLTDHLGSIDALCDENGSVVERYSYDVWGNRRNPSDWTLADARIAWITTRGFTGHEHLDKFGLINANARMYEPLTGKFLAPDPYVQAPDYSQSFNRYTYCWNNPVKYSDPSGEYAIIDDIIAGTIGGVLNLATNAIQGNLSGYGFWGGVGRGFAAFGAGAVGGVGALYPQFGGWVWGGATVGATNAWLGGATSGEEIAIGAGIGAIAGVAGGAAGQWAGQNIGGVVINRLSVASPVLKGAIAGTIGGAAGGYVGGFTGGLIMTGDFETANKAGINGLWSGAAIGGVVGGGAGYRYAKNNNINPWTGKPNKSITIGQTMSRVRLQANDLGSETIEIDWPDNVKAFKHNEPTQEGLKFNQEWIQKKMQLEYHIYDIGTNPASSTPSQYYNLELNTIGSINYPNVYRVNSYNLKYFDIRFYYYR
ncbi:MAG: RHS repeat-associated core domain-containing protein [Bacteroidales bacterium]|nr:RHS repeat-associated core domain-containing protein [Bacteroidales bacterium]